MRLLGTVLPAAILTAGLLSGEVVFAQTVDDVYPVEPADGGTIGPKGTFKIVVRGTDVLAMKFRIRMSQDGFETVALTFDQIADRNGWGFWGRADGNEQHVVYRVRKPIPDGRYAWRASAWNGHEWIDGRRTFRVRVDAVPPAEVTGIRMRVDKDAKTLLLEWDPVTTDRDGNPERVAIYRIYRYSKKNVFPAGRSHEIGTSTDTRFEDSGDTALETPVLYYRVVAEDEAGNEAGRPY